MSTVMAATTPAFIEELVAGRAPLLGSDCRVTVWPVLTGVSGVGGMCGVGGDLVCSRFLPLLQPCTKWTAASGPASCSEAFACFAPGRRRPTT